MDGADYEIIRTILDDLEDEQGKVRIKLRSGEIVSGVTDIIVYDDVDPEDDDNYDEIESIRFLPDDGSMDRYFTKDEIDSYEVIG